MKKQILLKNDIVSITQVKSPIGRKSDQRATLIGLGLNKIRRKVTIKINPSIVGMIDKVRHLLYIEKISQTI